jgi:DUF4097 and DUF4098 domain-containing protein YvlB
MKTFLWSVVVCTLLFVPARHAIAGAEPEGGEISRSFSVSKGGRLEVSAESGDIRVSPWEKNEVSVRVDGVAERDSDRVKMEQSGNTVTVRYRGKWYWHGGGRDVRFEINVPKQFDIDLETAGGDIDVRGTLTGELKGRTSGGDIGLEDITGTVSMKTSGGDITARKIQGAGTLKTSGGDIKVGSTSGDLEATTSGGDIRIDNVGKNLVAKTAGGDITVGDVGGEATVSTAGGDVIVGKVSGKATLSTAGGDIELRGASGVVTAKTAGGDVKLENISGSVEAKTAGGDVIAQLTPGGKGKSKLSSAGGDVKLYLPESAKATIEALIRVHSWLGGKSEYEIVSDFKSEKYNRDDGEINAMFILNGGGENITLSTVNANIEIRKLKK